MQVALFMSPDTLITYILGFTTISKDNKWDIEEWLLSLLENKSLSHILPLMSEHIFVKEDFRLEFKSDDKEYSIQVCPVSILEGKQVYFTQ